MGVNIQGNFSDFFGTGKLPNLEAVIEAKKESYSSVIPLLFNTVNIGTDIWQSTTLSGLRNPEVKPEAQPVTFQTIQSGYSKTITVSCYATGYAISKEAVDDGKVNFINRATTSFAKGAFELKEMNVASIFNNAFTTTGYDGVALCSASHPLENGLGVTNSNLGTAASLSLTSYRDLRNVMQDTLNENGQRVKYKASYFVYGQDLQDTGAKLMGSSHEPDNANNAINTVYNHCKPLPEGYWPHLSSTTAFFLVGAPEDNGLYIVEREAFNVDSDYNKKARTYEVMSFERYGYSWANHRGLAGNAGA